jgi:2'-5' RNA ligase
MALCAIHLFPGFRNAHLIEALRARYDPLAELIQPHITLVFPFETNEPAEILQRHAEATCAGFKAFPIRLQGITGDGGEHLFLNVKRGNDEIIELHDRLYRGQLSPFLSRSVTYVPHMTVGRLSDRAAYKAALAATAQFSGVFESLVTEVVAEEILPDESSVRLFTAPFGQ